MVCLFIRILEQKLLSSGMHLKQCNLLIILSKFFAHVDCYTIRGGQANRVSSQLCPWPTMSSLPSLSPVFKQLCFLLALPTPLLRRPSARRRTKDGQIQHPPLNTAWGHFILSRKYGLAACSSLHPQVSCDGVSGELPSTAGTDIREKS